MYINKKFKINTLIIVVLIAGSTFYWFKIHNSSTNKAKRTASAFLTGVYSSSPNKAYNLSTAELRSAKDRSEFAAVDGAAMKIRKFKYTSTEELANGQLGLRGDFSATPNDDGPKDGQPEDNTVVGNFSLVMTQVDGEWRVNAFVVD